MDYGSKFTIDTLCIEDFDRYIDQLAELYHEAVSNGAVLSQNSTFTIDQAYDYWDSLRDDFQEKRKRLLLLFAPLAGENDATTIIGTTQIVFSQKAILSHHCSIEKLMVTPSHQRQGIATDLLRFAEREVYNTNRTIITLDTSNTIMVKISKQLGYTLYGTIPEFVLTPKDELVDTYFFYKKL